MKFDNDNTGIIFEKQIKQELVGTGNITENGQTQRVAMIKADLPDGTTVRDVFVYIGRLWDNPSGAPNAPQFTGVYGKESGKKKFAAWANETEKGKWLSLKLTDDNSPGHSSRSSGDTSDIDVPF